MADIQANIGIGLDTSQALASIRQLQREISAFHTLMARGNANVVAQTLQMRQGLINSINETGKFSAGMTRISSTTESFTNALEKNKFSMGQYFRYAGASTKTFGRLFTREFDTINRVATERVKDLQTQYISMGRDANGALQAIKVRPLALDMDNLGTRTMLAAQKQQLFNQLLKQGSTNLLNFGKNTQWAGRQLMVGFTIPLAIFGTTAAREFMKLEEQAIRFKRVYGDMFTTSGETERALENVKQLATEFTKYGIALEETVGLAAKVAQMGNMGAALEAQVRQATRLSVLGGLEQQEALDTTISLTNAFGIATEDLADKINFLNAAENQTILSIEDFNEAIPKAGSVVKALGGDVEDLAFFLTAMREGGINASQGANALKSSLGRLINPSEEARKRLANMGIDVVGIVNANAGNLRGTIMALAVELDKLSSLDRSRAIEQLFGKFQFARMSTMLTNIVRDGSQANKVLQLTGNSAQELGIIAERELGRVEDSVAYKFQKSLEEFKAALAPLGGEFLKAITPIVEFATKVLNKFNEMGDGAKQFIVIMSAVLGAIGPVALMSFGLLANGVANLIKMFANLGIFYQKLSGQGKSLGMSTQYMTQEQIEAAAVASSLSQSHAQLTQVFGVETTALAKLTAAYQSATAAQRTFNAGAAARRAAAPAAKGMTLSSGILSVPGPKGAGDVVPAMLSPGEAVIPAEQAQKYSGFISSIMQDRVPGFRFGLNPFKNMFERSRVGVRMQSTDFMSAVRSGDTRYKTGFETKTGDDFTMARLGRPEARDPRKVQTRELTEDMFFGVKPNAPYSQRPTYGFVAQDGIMARLLNLVLGKRGAGFNKKANPMNPALDQYGDISLITRRSVGKRSEVSDKDALVFFRNLHMDYNVRGNAKNLKDRIANIRSNPDSHLIQRQPDLGLLKNTPLYGGNTAALDTIQRPNSYYNYLETYTKGGFKFKEIERIVARDAQTKRLLQKELREAGMSGIRVTSPGFISKMFKALGIPGFADGILSVPGPKGAGDVIPAMLSPGEAVIPAKQAKRHAPMINDLIRGRIPGYEEGVEVKEKTGQRKTTGAPKASPTTFMGYSNAVMLLSPGPKGDNALLNTRAGVNPAEFADRIRSGGKALQAPIADSIARSLLGPRPSQKAIADTIASNKNIGKFAAGVNDGIAKGVADWGAKNPGKGMPDAKFYEISEKAVKAEMNKKQGGKFVYDDNFRKTIRSQVINPTMYQDTTKKRLRLGKGGNWFMGEEGRDKIYKSGQNLSYRREYTGAIRALGGDPTKLRDYAKAHFMPRKPIDLSTIPKDQLSTPARNTVGRAKAGTTLVRVGDVKGTFKAKTVDTVNKALATMGLKINKNNNIVDENNRVVKSAQQQTKDAATETNKSTKATKKNTEEKAKGTAQQKKSTKAVAANTDRVVANTKAGEVIARKTASGQDRFYTRSADGRLIRMTERDARKAINRSEGSRKAAQTKAANKAPAPVPEPKAGEAAARSRLGGPGAIVGGIAGLGMLGAMGASFAPGKVGEVAQQLLFPLMMLPMILPLLKNPIVLAIAAVAALGAGIFMLHKKLQDASKSGVDAAQAMSMTSDKLRSISEVTGTVSATELRQKRQEAQMTGGGPEFSSFGLSYLQDSDQGKSMLADIEKQFESGRTMDEVGANIGRQLAVAITQGVLSVEQARSIASALGAELGDYSISMDISGKLTELLGIDGSDLLKDPLTVALRIKDDSVKEQAEVFEQAIGSLNYGKDNPLVVGLLSASAAAATLGIGLAAASIGPQGAATGPAALIAGSTSLLLAVGAGVASTFDRAEDRELAGAALQLGVEQLAQNQTLLDSVNAQYEAQISQLSAQADLVETDEERLAILEQIDELEQGRVDAIKEINAANAETTAQILEQAKQLDDVGLYESAIAESVRQRYAEGPMKVFANEAVSRLADMEDQDFAMALNLQMATGELNPISVLKLIEIGSENESLRASFTLGMKQQGSAQMNQLMQLLTQTEMTDSRFSIMLDFVVNKQGDDFDRSLEALSIITNAEARYPINIDIETSNGEEVLDGVIANLEKYEDMPETMTKQAFIDIAQGDVALMQIADKWDDLGLTDNIYRQFVIDFLTLDANADRDLVAAYMADQGIAVDSRKRAPRGGGALNAMGGTGMESNMPSARQVAQYGSDAVAWAMKQRAQVATDYNEGESEDTTDPTGGATPKVESLIQKLKELRLATLQLRTGWDGMNQSIQDFLNAGEVGFSGIANQMRRLGVGEGLIERITGMDPDEYEKRKNELFEFDNDGNINKAKQKLLNLNKAFNAVAIGEYVNGQEQFIQKTKDQMSAISVLTANGMSLADAYEAVQDEALAAAIAQGATAEEIKEILRITELVKEQEAELERQRERSRISESVRKTNEEFRNQVDVLKELSRAQGQYTDAQIQALMSDSDLQKLMLDPTIDSGALQEALRNAEQKSNLEVQINLLTKTGQETEFDKYLAEVNDYFTKEENLINVNFELATADDNKLIEDAQNQIAAIQYKLDDYNAELEQISWIEEDINEKYDKRSEALDTIADANEKIANQQKAQLGIADALSKGDIAAAARAIQELRNQEAQQAQETQKDQLERAREAELKAIVGPSGRTKEQLEEEITQLERQLFFIEEQTLEPAQERNRLAEITRDLAIDQLKLNEMTRIEFDKIAAATKQSAINMEDMITSSEKLAALAEFIQTGKKGADWDRLFPQPKAAPAPAPSSGGGGGGGRGGGSPAPAPTPTSSGQSSQAASLKADARSLDKQIAAANQKAATQVVGQKEINEKAALVDAKRWTLRALQATTGSTSYKASGGMIIPKRMAMGGSVRSYSPPPLQMNIGGRVKGYAAGGFSMGSDIVPAMLTPGEFVIRKRAVQNFGMDKLEKINSGTYNDGSVYNYNLAVNVKSDSDPNRIARAVITNIKSIENQRIRGNKL